MDSLKEILKYNLRSYRKLQGYTQEQLAESSGLSVTFIQDIELSRKQPSLDSLEKIAKALRVQPHKLLKDPDETESETLAEFAGKLKNTVIKEIDNLLTTI